MMKRREFITLLGGGRGTGIQHSPLYSSVYQRSPSNYGAALSERDYLQILQYRSTEASKRVVRVAHLAGGVEAAS
jgi:hypothetical protein